MIKTTAKILTGLLLSTLSIIPTAVLSQSTANGCPNANFSMGNFTNWTGYYGSYTSPASSTGIVNGRHTIVSAAAFDPNTCGGLITLPPGATVAAKLGNDQTGSQAERLTYSMTVDSSNALFIYKYAVVLQDPSHAATAQPKFDVRLLDQNGTQIGGNCGIYSVTAASGIPGFQTCGQVVWKNWTIVGINLLPWFGQTVTLEFTTYDCNQGGHYGYAYLAADCSPLEIDVTYCPGDNSVILTAPPGFATYSWNTTPPTPTQTLVVNNPTIGDTLIVTMSAVTNFGNCLVSLSAVLVPTEIYAGFEVNSPCEDMAIFEDTTVVINGDLESWLWIFGDGNTSTAQNPTHTYAAPGNYNVTLIAYNKPNQTGCSDTVTKTVTIKPKPDAGFTHNLACLGLPVQFTDTTAPNGVLTSWSWNFGPQATPSTSTSQNPVVTYNTAGTYNATLVATNQDGCIDSITVPVLANSFPSIDFAYISQCEQTPVNFVDLTQTYGVDSIVSWTWDMDDGNFNFTENPSHPFAAGGIYNVEMVVQSANGCMDSITKSVQIYHNPLTSFTADNECFNDAISFNNTSTVALPSNAMTWQWDFGDSNTSTGQNPSHTYAAPGDYIVSLTATSNHNCIATFTDTVSAFDYPQTSFSVSDICVNQTAAIINSSINPSDGSIGNFVWDFGDGSATNTVDLNPAHDYATAGTYTVTLINYSTNLSCPDTFQQQIIVHPMTEANFVFNDTCYNKTSLFTDQSIGQISAWRWDFGDNSNYSSLTNSSHIFSGPGTYDVELLVTSIHGCSDSITKQVKVWPLPVPNFSTMNVCEGDMTYYYDLSLVPSPHNVVNHSWSFGDGSTGTGTTPTHTYSDTGNYTVQLIATSDVGCVDSISRSVRVSPIPVPQFSLNDFEGCRPVCIQFSNHSTIGSGDSISSIAWTFGDGGDAYVNNPQYCYTRPGVYDVTLTLESNRGCSATLTMTDTIKVYEFPVANFEAEPWVTQASEPIIYFNNTSIGGDYYHWNFGDNQQSESTKERNPTHTYISAGEYTVSLKVTTEHGCEDYIEYVVIVEPDFTLYVPSAFSPNGDGVNDYFKAEGIGIEEYELYIYDRWGELVFQSDNIDIGWDGRRYKGAKQDAMADVYVYVIKARNGYNGTHYEKQGHFTLIR